MGLFDALGSVMGVKAPNMRKMEGMSPLTRDQIKGLRDPVFNKTKGQLENNPYHKKEADYYSRLADQTAFDSRTAQREVDEQAVTGQVTGSQAAKRKRQIQRDMSDINAKNSRQAGLSYLDAATAFDNQAIQNSMSLLMGGSEAMLGNYMQRLAGKNQQAAFGRDSAAMAASLGMG